MPEEQSKEKRRAIIIGIDEYQDSANFQKLDGAENDAKELYEKLSDPLIGKFDIPKKNFLLGNHATSENILKSMSDVFWNTDNICDLALFYFSGHGVEDGYHDGYIAPYDILMEDLFVHGINMGQLKQVINKSHNKCVIVILDCCYSAIITEGDRSAGSKTKYDENIHGFVRDVSAGGRIILASSEGKSREDKFRHVDTQEPHAHGIFTYHLLNGLDGKAESNKKGEIYLDKLVNYTTTKLGEKQKPKFYVSQVGSESFGISGIQIAVISKKRSDFIEEKIGSAKQFYGLGHISSLIEAIPNICDVLIISEENAEANELKNKIEEDLAKFKNQTEPWLNRNEAYIRGAIPTIFPKFRQLCDYLHFDKVVNLKEYEQSLLFVLYDAINGQFNEAGQFNKNAFIERCRGYERDLCQPKSMSGEPR